MVRNDYRRSLIMLRAHERGYSGHVRLEHRTLTGSMYFVIGVPAGDNPLCAALVRRDAQGVYYASRIGELRRDGRGQASLAYSFDPRNIDGYPLDDYLLIAVVERGTDRCDLALSGNVNGSREVNWSSVSTAACYACQDHDAEEPIQPREAQQAPALDGDVRESDGEVEGSAESVQPPEEESPEMLSGTPAADIPTAEETPAAEEGDNEQSVAGLPDVDTTVAWPGVSEALRSLFASLPADDDAPDDGYVYICAPMPEESGYDHVEIGVQAEEGLPVAVAYALPDHFSAEPPAGLEDFIWRGGANRGWWTIYIDAESGEPLS